MPVTHGKDTANKIKFCWLWDVLILNGNSPHFLKNGGIRLELIQLSFLIKREETRYMVELDSSSTL